MSSAGSAQKSEQQDDGHTTADEDQKERDHFQKVVDAFRYYRLA